MEQLHATQKTVSRRRGGLLPRTGTTYGARARGGRAGAGGGGRAGARCPVVI